MTSQLASRELGRLWWLGVHIRARDQKTSHRTLQINIGLGRDWDRERPEIWGESGQCGGPQLSVLLQFSQPGSVLSVLAVCQETTGPAATEPQPGPGLQSQLLRGPHGQDPDVERLARPGGLQDEDDHTGEVQSAAQQWVPQPWPELHDGHHCHQVTHESVRQPR